MACRGVAVAIAVAVAASRVLLDLHWLSDVVGGLALGWGWFALCAARLRRPAAEADGRGRHGFSGRDAPRRTDKEREREPVRPRSHSHRRKRRPLRGAPARSAPAVVRAELAVVASSR